MRNLPRHLAVGAAFLTWATSSCGTSGGPGVIKTGAGPQDPTIAADAKAVGPCPESTHAEPWDSMASKNAAFVAGASVKRGGSAKPPEPSAPDVKLVSVQVEFNLVLRSSTLVPELPTSGSFDALIGSARLGVVEAEQAAGAELIGVIDPYGGAGSRGLGDVISIRSSNEVVFLGPCGFANTESVAQTAKLLGLSSRDLVMRRIADATEVDAELRSKRDSTSTGSSPP